MSLAVTKAMSEKETNTIQEIIAEHIYHGLNYRRPWLELFTAAIKFYFSKQLSENEKKILDLKGQERFITNHLRPNLKSLQSFLTANKPSWNVLAGQDDDGRATQIWNGMLTYIWDISHAYHKVYRVTRNMLIGGSGRAMPVIDYRSRKGLGDVKVKDVPPENFVGDWRSREVNEEDARFQAIITTDNISMAYGIRPDLKKKISTFEVGFDDEFTVVDEDDFRFGKVNPTAGMTTALGKNVEYYRLIDKDLWEVVDRTTNERFTFLNKPDIVLPNYIDVVSRNTTVLEKYFCLYDGIRTLILDKEVMPIENYIISHFINEDTDNIFPLGETYFVMDLLRWINKSFQQTMYHAQVTSNPVTYWPEGSGDISEAERKGSIPGAHIEFDASRGSPIFKQPAPLNNAWYTLAREYIEQVKSHIGATGAFTGDPAAQTGNASEFLMAMERGSDRAKVIFRNFETGLEMLGKSTAAIAKSHYDFPMWLKWVDSRKKNRQMFINGVTINTDKEDKVEMESLYLKDFDIDIKLVTSSYMPTNGVARTQVIQQLYGMAPDYAKHPLLIEMMQGLQIDQDLIDEVDQLGQVIPNFINQLTQLAGENKELKNLIDGLKKQLLTADRRAVRADFEKDLQGQLSKRRADLQVSTEKLKLQDQQEKLIKKE